MSGLDLEDVQWIRDLMWSLAAQGRTVLVSSHQVSEMALTADQLLIVRRGELLEEISTRQLIERFPRDVFVRTPRRGGLTRLLTGLGATVLPEPGGGLSVTGMDAWKIASAAAEHYIPIQELTPRNSSLENFVPVLSQSDQSIGGCPKRHD
jgi:ABC-2 type transport system ATP-binding protein